MRVAILIPCHNEEKLIAKCVQSCLDQTRPADEIFVVDDGSADKTAWILSGFGNSIKTITIAQATGNKSYAQETGLQYITSDIFITVDADTQLDREFVKCIEEDFNDSEIVAVGGYVKSQKYNWLTACRALDYTIGQNLYKLAQSRINFLFVIPGTAGAFRTEIFKQHISFDHDTLTEDLDFTYKLHQRGFKIKYDRRAIVHTQDPVDLHSYINQMRRWFGGGWQNLLKHYRVAKEPARALELSLMYIEGLIFSALLYLIPLFNLNFALYFIGLYSVVMVFLSLFAGIKEKRLDIIYYSPLYLVLIFINSWIFWEQFLKEVVLRKKNLVWFKPDRVEL